MKILYLGDVMGRSGRRAVAEHLPRLRTDWRLDFVVVNGDNATSGMGLSPVSTSRLMGDKPLSAVTFFGHVTLR